MYFVFLYFGKVSYLSLYYNMLTYTHSFCHCNIHRWRQLWFLKVDNGTIFNRNIISHEDTFGIWCSVNFKPLCFKTFNRTLVVVIGSKLFSFSWEKQTALTVSVLAWIWNSKYLSWYTGDTLWMYPANVSECDRFSAITVKRKKKKNMNTE